ncbi:uncharacterized protein [Dermacentor albipictus]|uniref:uncharacterized protein isoform X4 n=1 Tax=Dermacentor albipictus TaxID=60249 RepID=UPI0038FBF1A8
MSANTRSSGNHCVIFGCTNNYRKRKLLAEQTCDVHQQPRRVCGCELVKFHRFPADPEHRRLWIASVNRKDFLPSDSSRVCSVHFVSGERTETNPIPMRSLGYERKVKVGRRRIVRGDYVPTKRRRLPGDEVESAQPEPCAPIDYQWRRLPSGLPRKKPLDWSGVEKLIVNGCVDGDPILKRELGKLKQGVARGKKILKLANAAD